MSLTEVNPTPGTEIRRLREERGLRPVDIHRISETVRIQKNCPDFSISHATLSDIENSHSIPNVRKMFSLAVCFRVPLEQILALYGASRDEVAEYCNDAGPQQTRIQTVEPGFFLNYDTSFDARRTGPVVADVTQWPELVAQLHARPNSGTCCYGWVGTMDDAMADLIPAGSLIEIDRQQCVAEVAKWSTLRERPIYFSWTKDGYRCSWCEENAEEIVLLAHPASHVQARRYRKPREAALIGRVIHAWVPFGKPQTASTRIGAPRSSTAGSS